MACNTLKNTHQELLDLGYINDNYDIIPEHRTALENFITEINKTSQQKYGIMEPLVYMRQVGSKTPYSSSYYRDNYLRGTKVSFNQAAFEILDLAVAEYNKNMEEAQKQQEDDARRAGEMYGEDFIDYEPFFDEMPDFNPDFIPEQLTFKIAFENYIQYKENLIYRAKMRLAQLARQRKINSTDAEIVKKIISLENEINLRLNGNEKVIGLVDELQQLKDAPTIDKFRFYAEADLARLAKLVESENEQDLAEASVIINQYEAIGTFEQMKVNPLFSESQMFEDGKLVIPQEIQDKLIDLKNQAVSHKNSLIDKQKKNIVNLVNGSSKIQNTFNRNFSYDELFHTENGLSDVNFVDLFLMDVTNGIFSTNGIVPQVMMNIIQNSFESNLVQAKAIELRVEALQGKVERILKEKGFGLSGFGIKGVSYDIFRAKNSRGQFRDGIVQRYTAEYLTARQAMLSEVEDKLAEARQASSQEKTVKFKEAFKIRDDWYKKNTIHIDVRKIASFKNDFANDNFSFIDDGGAHETELKELLGEHGFNEEVAKQAKLIKDYLAAKEVYRDSLLVEFGLDVEDAKIKSNLNIWEKRNSPFELSKSLTDDKPIMRGKLSLDSTRNFNLAIPRKKQALLKLNMKGTFDLEQTDKDTGFYDKDFETIESDDTLKEFHTLLMEVNETIMEVLPPDVREKFHANSLPQLKKSIIEVLFDPNISLIHKISSAARELYERIFGALGIKIQSSLSQATIDPLTGKPDFKVNDEFLSSNKQEIDSRYKVEAIKMKAALGLSVLAKRKSIKDLKWSSLPAEVKMLLKDNLDPNVFNSFKDSDMVNPLSLLKDGIVHQVVQEQSFDLPKMMKLFSFLAMEYNARQEVLPVLSMMKSHYEDIKKPSLTNTNQSIINSNKKTRLDGVRTQANKQMESWFERVVLGDYGSKTEFGDPTIRRIATLGLTGQEKLDSFTERVQTTITGKILTKEEKMLRERAQTALSEIEREIKDNKNPDKAKVLEGMKGQLIGKIDTMGKRFSWAKALDSIFNFIRLKGLGWNISSQTTNFMEGQIGNFISAATGQYFTPENIYRANNIVQGSFFKNASFGKVTTPGAELTSVLMKRYRVLQDASNELQKASAKSAFSAFSSIGPYELMKRTEFMNQAPLMVAILMDQKIYGTGTKPTFSFQASIDDSFDNIVLGNKTSVTRNIKKDVKVGDTVEIKKDTRTTLVKVTNVRDLKDVSFEDWQKESGNTERELYDSLVQQGYKHYNIERTSNIESSVWDAMNPDGTLKDEFRTEENIKNWEQADGQQYNDFASHVKKTIVNTHGDYDELRGNKASEYVSGKALLMFKRWMTRQFYTRFGAEQADIEIGVEKFKGRYKSHTQTTGAIHAGIIGFAGLGLFGLGPVGLVLGLGVGALTSKFYGADTKMGFLQESAFVGKEIFLSLMRMPVNSMTGKDTIKSANYGKLGLNETDLKNYRANIIDISLTLAWIALLLFTKGLFWDDDDDPKDTRRKTHNYFANKFMQLSSQATMYVNPIEFKESITNIPVIKFFTDLGGTAAAFQKYLEGDDIIATGINAGESNLYNKTERAFFPSVIKSGFGFESQMERQFKPSAFDKWFSGEDKEAKGLISAEKAKTKKRINANDYTEQELEIIEKELDKFFRKPEDMSYEENLERIANSEGFDVESVDLTPSEDTEVTE